MTAADDTIWIASQYVGIGADPNAITRQYRPNPDYRGDWCAVTIAVVFDLAGGRGMVSESAWVPSHEAFFRAQSRWYGGSSGIRRGDVILFDYEPNGVGNHIGIVESVDATTIYTIEGNTSDRMARRSYAHGHPFILGYGRPAYNGAAGDNERPLEDPEQEDDDMTLYVRPNGNSTPLPDTGLSRVWAGDNRKINDTLWSGVWELTQPGARRLPMAEWAGVQSAHAAAGRKVPVGDLSGNQLETIIYTPAIR